jgi:hypothetical protein
MAAIFRMPLSVAPNAGVGLSKRDRPHIRDNAAPDAFLGNAAMCQHFQLALWRSSPVRPHSGQNEYICASRPKFIDHAFGNRHDVVHAPASNADCYFKAG